MNRPFRIDCCKPKFDLGQVVATRAVHDDVLAGQINPAYFIGRHVQADWGEMEHQDKLGNDRAVLNGGRLFSAYDLPPTCSERRLWVITEADRSSTTLLFPSEY